MAATPKALADDAARKSALVDHDRSFLIEAGAGSGKTAVLAGRIAMMLAEGVVPRTIVAVTFTEFAASELLIRVREFVGTMADGIVPVPLGVALPDGLSEIQRGHLANARKALDELTCSTIHGFCQRLIAPYPVEADIDPGAAVMDRDHADRAFHEIRDAWLREQLTGEEDSLLAELVQRNPDGTVKSIHTILDHRRRHREIAHEAAEDLLLLADDFMAAVDGFCTFATDEVAEERDTVDVDIARRFRELGEAVETFLPEQTPANLVSLLDTTPHLVLVTTKGPFRKYKKITKWRTAAKRAGLSHAKGARLNKEADSRYTRCCETWTALRQAVASHVLAELIPVVREAMKRFRDHKRSAALLDFDDLILAARDLLRDHDDVRQALAARYTRVLVDEFQDTDPLQTEIFWRLCGDPPAGHNDADWTTFSLRPGALFLVGDPKQAIYRFRGADISAYIRAREAFRGQSADGVLSITTNFRSCAPIMEYVNHRFESILSEEKQQPGFQALNPFQPARTQGPSVAVLDIVVGDENGEASMEQQRNGEAEAIAEMCARIIGCESVRDPESGQQRQCRASDIALLAPTGTQLWRYEEALEQRGIPVASQAGKGLYKRQEIQDLIAVTRVLADHRDTLAFGALLRGPLVGLSEEELLDIVWALPRPDDAPDELPRFDVRVTPDTVANALARDTIKKLQALRSKVHKTTPYALLSEAVDVLRVRPILFQRHRGQVQRAMANVDHYLSLSRAYAVRGLRAFAEAMTAAWCDEEREKEGRPDAQEEAVALYTMHAAKGLEWPIVVPTNTMTELMSAKSAVTDRVTGQFYCSVLGVKPSGHETARKNEISELDRERVRLWYVATTRARELLVLPRLDVAATRPDWRSSVDLGLDGVPALDLDHHPHEVTVDDAGPANNQTRNIFKAEAAKIADCHRSIDWRVPSRGKGKTGPTVREEVPEALITDGDGKPEESQAASKIKGGRERGNILHKIIEEVLTGETAESMPVLVARAEALIRELELLVLDDPALGLAPAEIADCVVRALSLPEVAAIRPALLPEFPVYASSEIEAREEVVTGIADAIALGPDGTPQVVIDWKSDVELAPDRIKDYQAQMRAYLEATDAERGLIVAVTTGKVIICVTKQK